MKKYPGEVLKTIEEQLLEEKGKLEVRLKSYEKEDPFSDPDRVNDNAASDTESREEIDHERIEALEHDVSMNIKAIDEAIKRIKKGSYGFCESCGNMIDTDRLNANPTAKFCMSCEKKMSRG